MTIDPIHVLTKQLPQYALTLRPRKFNSISHTAQQRQRCTCKNVIKTSRRDTRPMKRQQRGYPHTYA